MKLFTRTSFVGAVGLFAVTAGSPAMAAHEHQAAPATCPGMDEAEATLESQYSTREPTEKRKELFGPVALLADALSKICLSDEQRAAVEKLGDRVSAKEEAVADARHALHLAVAKQLESGKIDKRALTSEIDELVKAREEASPVLRKALSNLHAILDPGQRAALADRIDSRLQELADASSGWLDELAKDLGLSENQKRAIGDVLARAKPGLEEDRKTAVKAFDDFKKDDFSMEHIVPLREVGERTRKRAETMLGIATEISDILTPEQREKLAKRIEGKIARHAHDGAPGVTTSELETDETDTLGEAQESIIVGRAGGFRAGAVRGWGGGGGYVAGYRGGYVGGYRGGYAGSGYAVRGVGYAAGYPLGGYGVGVW